MKEAVGSALLLNIVLVFVGIISMLLVGSIGYSKAYKVKNRIVSIIEKYDGDCFEDNSNPNSYVACYQEIEEELKNMGYSSNISASCPDITVDDELKIEKVERVYPQNFSTGHRYCVYKYTLCDELSPTAPNFKCSSDSNETHYYKVFTFMHFDIPVIGSFLEFQVSGETRQFYDTFVNIIN